MNHYYIIEKPFINLKGEEDTATLCRHLQDETITRYQPIFAQFNWSEMHFESLDDCIDMVLEVAYAGITKSSMKQRTYLVETDLGYEVFILAQLETLTGKETYQGSQYLATIYRKGNEGAL